MWNKEINDEATSSAYHVLHELLDCDLIYNSDKHGKLVNELSNLMYEGASVDALNYMASKANRVGDYMALSFVIEESLMLKDVTIFPLIKLLLKKDYFRIKAALIDFLAINAEDCDDVNLIVNYLSDRNIVVCARTMNVICYILTDHQIEIMLSTIGNDKLRRFFLGNFCIDDFLFEMSCDEKISKMLIFCAATRLRKDKNELLKLEQLASCEEISEFFYFYVK
ncbi:MAG: hypothetical protein RI964_1757 [Pseudomonadota bacterium]|jgi:hypothetical protein